MEHKDISFEHDSNYIYTAYAQAKAVKGVIVLVHGFGEHSGRYKEAVIPMLIQTGLAVVYYDNIGHGKSDGKRGHCKGYPQLMTILELVIQKAKVLFPDSPLFLYGHSMGGNLVLNYALRNQISIAGIVATSPYLRLAFSPPKWKMTLGKVMMKIAPSITLPSGLDPSGISKIPEEVAKYRADPLVQDKVSPMYSFPIIDAGEWAIKEAASLTIPTLLLHGTADPVIDHKATVEFHNKASVTSLQLFEGGYHELHYDTDKKEALECVSNWLLHLV